MLRKKTYVPKQTIISAENLNEIQDEIINMTPLSGVGAPTTETVGAVNQKYRDTVTNWEYVCTAVNDGVYTWVQCTTDISGKADKVNGAAAGNLATLDNTGNLTDSGKKVADFATTLSLEMNSTTYVLTVKLKNSSGTVLATGEVDLPIESMIVNASYDATNKKLVLTLQSGSVIEVPIADLISGLVPDSRTINTKQLNANIILYASDISLSSTDNTTVKTAIENLGTSKVNKDGDSNFAIGTDSNGIYYELVV